MHRIYSCSDENLEVFTVISSKSCSPVRRKTKSAQCVLSKKVVALSDYHPPRTEELPSHQRDLIQVFCKDEGGQDFSHAPKKQQASFSSPTKCTTIQTGITKQRSFCCNNSQSHTKTLQPQASPISNHIAKRITVTEPATKNGIFAEQHGKPSRKNTEDNISAVQGSEASLPLTGSTLYGTPSLLRKIWMKHKRNRSIWGPPMVPLKPTDKSQHCSLTKDYLLMNAVLTTLFEGNNNC